jgi:hypothetical protein
MPPVQDSGLYNQQTPPAPPVTRGSNGVAVAGLVFGILGIILCPLGIFGILAIIFGAVGMSKARKVNAGAGQATAGLILGIVAVVLMPILIGIMLPALNQARTLAKNAMSATNLNGLGKAVMLYQAAYEMYPDTPGRLVEKGYASEKMFSNPKSNNHAAYHNGEIITDGYVIIMPEQGAPADDVMAYESESYAYKGKVAVVTVDGSVNTIPVEELHAKLAEQETRPQLPAK